jgi:predicted metal-dependent HD superfamily phosphohydrolase
MVMLSTTSHPALSDAPVSGHEAADGTRANLGRWQNLWLRLGAGVPPLPLFRMLIDGYSQPHRRYHTLQHLGECLQRLDEVAGLAERPDEVELALWFHDAIYQTQRADNETRSACWARAGMTAAGLDETQAARVYDMVMATHHEHAAGTPDARLVADIDLSILGATPARFDEYEKQVREEYAWVPTTLYRIRRRQLLHGFLARNDIYATTPFRSTHEQQARENLGRSLAR